MTAKEQHPTRPCRACGRRIPWSARFCAGCGAYQNPPADRRARQRRYLDRWRAVRGVVLFYVIYLLTILPLFWTPEEHKATGILVVGVVDAVLIMSYWAISRVSVRPLLVLNRPAVVWSLAGLAALVPLLAANIGYHRSLVRWFELTPDKTTDPFDAAGYGLFVVTLAVCVMPAIWEEIAFRGIIQGALSKAVGTRQAILTTAILFAIIHRSVLSGPYLFVLGLVLGLMRRRSNSLVPGMVTHFAHNLVVVLIERYDLIGDM